MAMKTHNLIVILLLVLAQAGPLRSVAAVSPLWQPLAPGIDYREFYLDTPNRVYVARMDRDNANVFIESSIGMGTISGGAETVRDQAQRYDDAINYWNQDWGGRNRVVVAINGSFFNTDTGVPWSGQVHSGWYAKRFEDRQKSSGFIWTLDRQAFIGTCVVNQPGKQQVRLLASEQSVLLTGTNVPRPENGLTLYTPQFDARTPAIEENQKLLEVLVELDQPLTIAPAPAQVDGVVRLVQNGEGGLPIPFDAIVLSATGKLVSQLKDTLQPGDRIAISQELRHLDPGCDVPNPDSWTNAYAGVAGSYIFLMDGLIQRDDDLGAILRNPRTAVALNARYVFFLVVDGRDRMNSQGMSMAELAVFAKTRLGASDGVALDGGGSSTMVVNGQVMNNPNAEQGGSATPQATPTAGPQGKIERVVANGLMMVVAQPKEQSADFKPGDHVTLQDSIDVNVRLGPGTNFGVLTALPVGSQGVIVEHPLNGVRAKGYNWWKIDFAGMIGWVNQDSLSRLP